MIRSVIQAVASLVHLIVEGDGCRIGTNGCYRASARHGPRINPSTCVGEMNRPTGPHIKDDIGDLDIHLEGCILEAKYMGMVMWWWNQSSF